jgi:hypothetical protein
MTILPQLEHDLFQAANERLPAADSPDGARRRRRGPHATGRWSALRRRLSMTATAAPLLLGIAITVIIAALALTLSHGGGQSPPATTAARAQTARGQLIQALGVLRRPQTKADLDPELVPGFIRIAEIPGRYARGHTRPPAGLERFLARMGYPKLDRALARVVKIPEWQAKVGIEPLTWRPSPSSHHRTEGLNLALWIGSAPTIPPSSDIGTGPTSVATFLAHGIALADNVRGTDRMDGIVLVPDGVAKITLRPIRILRAPVRVDPRGFGTVTATVHDNIAAFQLSIPTVTSKSMVLGVFGTTAQAQATWFDASGNVVKRPTTNLPVLIKVLGKRFPSRPSRALRQRLRGRFCRQNPHAC